jgi:LmbE family N-acetylglucosaminyl deacetylase
MTRALAFMAHPDDAEILIGGTLFRLKAAGWDLGIATMTSGDCGSATYSRSEISRIRIDEARAAAALLGASYDCAGLRDVEIFANAENLRRVVEVMRRFGPDAVITHSPVDYMLDHEEASRLVRSAAFAVAMPLYDTVQIAPAGVPAETPVLYYADPVEGADHEGTRVYPDFYVDVTETIELKRQMLSAHRSQRDWLRAHHGVDEYLNRVTAWAAAYGVESGVQFAEGLRQHRSHGYPRDPLIQNALQPFIRLRK